MAQPTADPEKWNLLVDGDIYETGSTSKYENRTAYRAPDRGTELTELPGLVIEILVKPGDRVTPRTPIYTLEAMKMHNVFNARFGGKVKRVIAKPGDRLAKNQPVIEYE